MKTGKQKCTYLNSIKEHKQKFFKELNIQYNRNKCPILLNLLVKVNFLK